MSLFSQHCCVHLVNVDFIRVHIRDVKKYCIIFFKWPRGILISHTVKLLNKVKITFSSFRSQLVEVKPQAPFTQVLHPQHLIMRMTVRTYWKHQENQVFLPATHHLPKFLGGPQMLSWIVLSISVFNILSKCCSLFTYQIQCLPTDSWSESNQISLIFTSYKCRGKKALKIYYSLSLHGT